MDCKDNWSMFTSIYDDLKSSYKEGLTDDEVMKKHNLTKDVLQVFKMSENVCAFGDFMSELNEIFNPGGYYKDWCDYNTGIVYTEEDKVAARECYYRVYEEYMKTGTVK